MTSSLKDRLAAKSVRRSSIWVPLHDAPQASLQELQEAEVALALIADDAVNATKKKAAARKKRDAIRAAYDDAFAEVIITAMPRGDYEALCEASDTDGDDGYNWTNLLPEVLAASCTDTDLRDVAWWREQLAKWPQGDFAVAQHAVVELNMGAPQPLERLGKG